MKRADTSKSMAVAFNRRVLCVWLILGSCLLSCHSVSQARADNEKGSVVTLQVADHGWELRRNGEPFFIKGAGGTQHLEALANAGGNSIRTWSGKQATEVLDRAHALGLTVTVGIWLQHERHGFDYANEKAVADQLQTARHFVEQTKDHPALLMWSLGNEVEGDGNNPLVWEAINDAAAMVKQVDPNHPTMTVIAEIGGKKIEHLRTYCPDIDVLGINAYGGLPTLGERLLEAGLDRPYIVTEYGPLGQWEVAHTSWNAPIEQTSTQKAKYCTEGYTRTIAGRPNVCLGGYVFHWGSKQEVTPTWYGLFLKDGGDTTEVIDAMIHFWTGAWPENRAPSIRPITINSKDLEHVKAGELYHATVEAADPDRDPLTYDWVVQSESNDRRTGGDFEQTPPTHPELIVANGGRRVSFKAPTEPGAYRLFVYVRDGQGHAATANVPFFVVP
jgi:Glycosyl hydrolases family 2, TIM barrel domain